MSDAILSDVPKLGFGLMRLPRRGVAIDLEQTKRMVDLFLAAGFTYFDTAYVYPGSETAAKRSLVDRYPRDSFTLATKINAGIPGMTEKMAKKEFATSLERTGAGHFDYYLLHALMENNVRKYEEFGIWEFAAEQKARGLIRHIGFSFHGGPKLLDRLLTEHPETEFVQLQINYADWESEKVASRANYEIARKHGMPIVIMEPVKGGKLADPPKKVRELFSAYAPDASYASWAIRFAASLDGVLTVLSGMSDLKQMNDNLSYMKRFEPLNEEEREILRKAQQILKRSAVVPCTACRYCVDGCPRAIPIPEIFSAMNLQLGDGRIDEARKAYAAAVGEGHTAADCISCRKCENVCPQKLKIAELLSQGAEMFGC